MLLYFHSHRESWDVQVHHQRPPVPVWKSSEGCVWSLYSSFIFELSLFAWCVYVLGEWQLYTGYTWQCTEWESFLIMCRVSKTKVQRDTSWQSGCFVFQSFSLFFILLDSFFSLVVCTDCDIHLLEFVQSSEVEMYSDEMNSWPIYIIIKVVRTAAQNIYVDVHMCTKLSHVYALMPLISHSSVSTQWCHLITWLSHTVHLEIKVSWIIQANTDTQPACVCDPAPCLTYVLYGAKVSFRSWNIWF